MEEKRPFCQKEKLMRNIKRRKGESPSSVLVAAGARCGVEEDALVDVIVLAISRAIRGMEKPPEIDNTKIAKISYDVAESLDLPITRSWYKYGTFVWSENAKEERLNQFLGRIEPTSDINRTIEIADKKERDLFQAILDEVLSHAFMMGEGEDEFIHDLYRKMAPPQYQRLYLANRMMTQRLYKNILGHGGQQLFPEPQLINASREISEFQRAMSVFEDYPDILEMAIDATSLMEDLAITYDARRDVEHFQRPFRDFFGLVYDFYNKTVWDFPASLIALDTTKKGGSKKPLVIRERRDWLATLPVYSSRTEELRDFAYLESFYPSRTEIQNVQKRVLKSLDPDEKKLVDDFFMAAVSCPRE